MKQELNQRSMMMNKAEERFGYIYNEKRGCKELDLYGMSDELYEEWTEYQSALEAKEIAIEFYEWMNNYKIKNGLKKVNLADVPDGIKVMDYIMDMMWNEFIEERYER